MQKLPDGSGFFVANVDTTANAPSDPVRWNPWNKVVQDHRDGTVNRERTNEARAMRGMPVPWTPAMGASEVHNAPVR